MKLQKFEGGVSSRLAPQLLDNNQGVVYENIDNARGVLAPVKDKLSTDIVAAKYNRFYFTGDEWLSSTRPTDYLEFQGTMYLTDRLTRPRLYENNAYSFLGIEPPAAGCTTNPVSAAVQLESFTSLETVGGLGDLANEDLDYLLFNIRDGIYSVPLEITVFFENELGIVTQATLYAINRQMKKSGFRPRGSKIRFTDNGIGRLITFSELEGNLADSARLYRLYDGAYRFVGEVFDTETDIVDDVYDLSNQPEINLDKISAFNSTYQYLYTFYNSKTGVESAPSALSEDLFAASGYINVAMPSVSTDPQVDKKRIYRLGGEITVFTLVDTVPNTSRTYADRLKDTDLDGRLLESANYFEAPIGLQFLSESYAMLFGAIGTSLRFTPIGVPTAWPPEYEIQFDADITGIGPVANGILVFTRFKTFIVTGTGPTSLSQQLLRGDQGCIAFESIQEAVAGTVIWASDDGLCSSSGNNVTSLTKTNLGDTLLEPISSVVSNEVYYCLNKDGSILSWDYRFSPTLKWLDLGIEFLSQGRGGLYGYAEGTLYLLFGAQSSLPLKYLSPLFIEGAFTEQKTYKKLYVRSAGELELAVFIDDAKVATFSLDGIATHQLQIPQQLQRGYSIQFSIEGTGTVNEIEYLVSQRQNA